MPTNTEPEVGLTLKSKRPGRPPMQRIEVDLAVHNTDGEPRWFLLPAHAEHWPEHVSVDGVEPVSMGGVVVGSFQGSGAFVALRVGAHGKVTVHGLELSSMSAVKTIDVRVAKAITVGDKPVASWFPHDPPAPTATSTTPRASRSRRCTRPIAARCRSASTWSAR